jgi:hypothetical protein
MLHNKAGASAYVVGTFMEELRSCMDVVSYEKKFIVMRHSVVGRRWMKPSDNVTKYVLVFPC